MYKVIGANQQQYGPVTAQQLCQWIAEGRVNADTLVQPEGATEWKPLRAVPELSSMLGPNPANPPLIAPTTAFGSYGRQTNGMALAGMIMGILSFTVGWFCCGFGPVFSILGIVFSCIGFSQINRNPELYTGKGFAITGLVLSVLRLVMMICFIILFGMLGAFGRLLSAIH